MCNSTDGPSSPISNDALFSYSNKPNHTNLKWKHYGIYRAYRSVKCFLVGPDKPIKPDENFVQAAATMINAPAPDEMSIEIIQKGKELLRLQRNLEDTRARRRLEKWACVVIALYLLVVFALVVLNGASMVLWPNIFKEHGFISDTVMTVILSTTTVNIIGLGVIVLKGHFNKNQQIEEASSDNE